MPRSSSSFSILGWIFGRKKSRRRRATKTRTSRRYIWIFLALMTGTGGAAGYSEYDVLRAVFRILYDRFQQQRQTTPATTCDSPDALKVYFTTPGQTTKQPGPAEALAGYIDAAKSTLDVAAFELDNRVITDALLRAHRRGVRVRLVTETNYLNEVGIRELQAAGVPIVDDKREGALMHNKFVVFDRAAVWTGSMNFTENCAYRNNNNGALIPNAKLAENYSVKFAWMFEQRKFGGLPNRGDRIPNPVIRLADGTQIENYFSTHDQPAKHVADAVKLARKSIHFMAFSFTHDGIGRAMLDRAAAGAEVSGVFERTQTATGHSEYERMRQAGLEVYLDGNPRNMHHKVIIIDREIVIFGSFNFSESADKSNDENLLIVYNRALAAEFEEEFERVRAAAR